MQHDIAGSLKTLGGFLDRIADDVENAGLDEVLLGDTKLVGFDGLGLRSRDARIVSLKLERDVNFQSGLFVRAVIEAEHANWSVGGAWRRLDDGTKLLELKAAGADLREFFAGANPDDPEVVYADSPFGFMLNIPYSEQGDPRQAVARFDIDKGRLRLDSDYDTSLIAARFNLRILPEKNQIELERSPIKVPSATMNLIGGLKFPQTSEGGESSGKPVFELIANDIESRALLAKGEPAQAAIRLGGWIDGENKALHADEISLTSKTGAASGTGRFGFAGETPSVKLNLKVAN